MVILWQNAFMALNPTVSESVVDLGFAIIPRVLEASEVDALNATLEAAGGVTPARRRGSAYAIRHVLEVVPGLSRLATLPKIRALVEPLLGPDAFPVRSILFDKTMGANWKVPWHQDLTIAVRKKVDVSGFGPWSTKAGVLHVQPPASILDNMLAVRIHLDDCDESNGPVRVIPGSHRRGRLTTDQLLRISTEPSVCCTVPAGGVMLMRPLLVHASSACREPRHRRVIHIEFASCPLPGGLEWFTSRCLA